MGIGRIPGSLGANTLAGLTSHQLQVKVAAEAARRATAQIGKRLSQMALKKASSRIIGKMAVGSRFWEKAFKHIAEHFDEQALATKAVHAVFATKYRTKGALEALLKQGAAKAGRRTLSQATIAGNPLGRPVVILEREFSEVIGEELTKRMVNGVEVIDRVPCKILRIIVDYTGKPVTAYPVKAFL